MSAPTAELRALLHELVAEVGPERGCALLERAAGGGGTSLTTRAPTLQAVADVVGTAHNLESLTRPLLEALQKLTGLASTYLTVVHAAADEQEIRFSNNARAGFSIPEGLRVPWADTLCRRALDQGRPCTTQVSDVWSDSEAAKALGIETYVSVAVRLADGSLWGTLCGADSQVVEESADHLPTLGLFARLIASEIDRAEALIEARRAAELDALTGCASRRGVALWLTEAAKRGQSVAAAFVDLDGFKAVNDTYGHHTGDRVLVEFARSLEGHSREEDLVGRLGGDEFVVAAVLTPEQIPGFLSRWSTSMEVVIELPHGPLSVHASIGTALVPPEEVGGLLAQADLAMYAAKHARIPQARAGR